jgi:LPXTG-motif cell wall-anchored protein
LGSESALAITIIAFIGAIAVSIGGFVVFKKSRKNFYH